MRLGGTEDGVRGLVPAARDVWRAIRATVLDAGVADQRLKDLAYRYLAGEVAEDDVAGLGERERATVEWARAIALESDRADDALWGRLHALFSEVELVDLGCAIGFELGRQHWRRTVGLPARGA